MKDTDVTELAQMFDAIIASPSAAVQQAFRNLAVLVALSEAEEKDTIGPFETMIRKMGHLEHELASIRRSVQILENTMPGHTKDMWEDQTYSPSMDYNIVVGNISIPQTWLTSTGASGAIGQDTITLLDINTNTKDNF